MKAKHPEASTGRSEYFDKLELPEDAAHRWMTNAVFQASQSMLRKHGGDYIDPKSRELPDHKQLSKKYCSTPNGLLCGVSEIDAERASDSD